MTMKDTTVVYIQHTPVRTNVATVVHFIPVPYLYTVEYDSNALATA